MVDSGGWSRPDARSSIVSSTMSAAAASLTRGTCARVLVASSRAMRNPQLSIALTGMGFCLACYTSPVAPTSRLPFVPRGAPVVSSTEIVGPNVVPPGESARFSLLAHLSDGSSRDVTNEARWSSRGKEVSVPEPGIVTGVVVGETLVQAQFEERDASKLVTVLVPGTYRLTGQVVDLAQPHDAIVGARVEVTAGVGAGQIAHTDGSSTYHLYGVSGEIGLRVSMRGYQTIERTIAVANHLRFDVELSYE